MTRRIDENEIGEKRRHGDEVTGRRDDEESGRRDDEESGRLGR
jgi:hypothetical protein